MDDRALQALQESLVSELLPICKSPVRQNDVVDGLLREYRACLRYRMLYLILTTLSSPHGRMYMKNLKSHGVDLDDGDTVLGWTALHYCCTCAIAYDFYASACALLDAGADPNKRFRNGQTALFSALKIMGDHRVLMKLLSMPSLDLDIVDNRKFTPIMHAIEAQNFDAVRVLVEEGVDINQICFMPCASVDDPTVTLERYTALRVCDDLARSPSYDDESRARYAAGGLWLIYKLQARYPPGDAYPDGEGRLHHLLSNTLRRATNPNWCVHFLSISVPPWALQRCSREECGELLARGREKCDACGIAAYCTHLCKVLDRSTHKRTCQRGDTKEASKPKPKPTHTCERPECDNAASKKCGACLSVYYCSEECKYAHWSTHKLLCQRAPKNNADAPTPRASGHPPGRRCARPKCGRDGAKQCSRCQAVYYCSKECQEAHWRTHKKHCKHASGPHPQASTDPRETLK
jgi:hypothetical protein